MANGAQLYDDYIHFLLAQGKTEEALQTAEYSRAQTLAEGLGLSQKELVSRTCERQSAAAGTGCRRHDPLLLAGSKAVLFVVGDEGPG